MSVQWDYLAFVLATIASLVGIHGWLRYGGRQTRISLRLSASVAALLVGGCFLTNAAGESARARVRGVLEGFAPTYAIEMQRLGHARIGLDTAPDDPLYRSLIEAQIEWQAVNPAIADVYTLRKLPDGQNVFIVDSETDYDRNGRYDDDREQRTGIGEVYDEEDEGMERAFAGESVFDDQPGTDRWGTWISSVVPLRDQTGRIEGILGVDYDGGAFVRGVAFARLAVIGGLAFLCALLLAYGTVVTLLRANLSIREQAEAEMRELNADLERRVHERTAQLEATHRELLDTSRRVGMAEVATDVLHNVGNVLNSVSVSSELVADKLRNSKLSSFAKLVALLREREADLPAFLGTDPQGRQIPRYLSTLAEHLSDEQTFLNGELASLCKHIEHIKGVLRVQQRLALVSDALEPLDLAELVEDALQINGASLARHGVEAVREYVAAPQVLAEKHKVLQILVNLISNAKDAVVQGGRDPRRIVLSVAPRGPEGVGVSVRDNGVGIAPEHLARIFAHGFTTKADGHGFGLHSAALAAKEMNGILDVQSDGPGRGATFVLELPVASGASEQAQVRSCA